MASETELNDVGRLERIDFMSGKDSTAVPVFSPRKRLA